MPNTKGTLSRATSLDARVAANVRAELARHQVRQGALAETIGRPANWLRRRLTGDVAFTVGEIGEIAEALGIPVAALLAEVAA